MLSYHRVLRGLLLAGAAFFASAPFTSASFGAPDATALQQRELFAQTRQQLARGQAGLAAGNMARLQDYPLYPYLELARLQRRLNQLPFADVDDFLARHPDSVVGDRLRETWLAALAFQNRWEAYLRYDEQECGTTHACWRIEALHRTGKHNTALDATERVWLTGRSLPEACDPGIARWLASSRDAQPLIFSRMMLALEAGQSGLAKYLASKLRDPLKQPGQDALRLARDPAMLASLLPRLSDRPHAGDVATLALQRLARRDSARAERLWDQVAAKKILSKGQHSVIRRAIGQQLIAARGADALPWLLARDPHGSDAYLLEWRIRLALRAQRWDELVAWARLLPPDVAATPRWQYWLGRALLAQENDSQRQEGRQLLTALANDRSYYGFLAADRLDRAYALNHQPMRPTVGRGEIAAHPVLRRVHEFYQLGERVSASREWSRGFDQLSEPERQAATLLVQSWGWHIQAIRAAADAGGWNDLDVRFPLAYEQAIRSAAQSAGIDPHWLFAVARQESAFIPDARSSAGAMGLLQLLPGTARQVAHKLGTPLQTGQLIDPAHSARFGGAYLKELLERYDGNRVLATAAYNAGPGRISRWLRTAPRQVDADIWIESLPYRETRDYVQNVLAYAVIYADHLGRESPLIAAVEQRIGGEPLQVSRSEGGS